MSGLAITPAVHTTVWQGNSAPSVSWTADPVIRAIPVPSRTSIPRWRSLSSAAADSFPPSSGRTCGVTSASTQRRCSGRRLMNRGSSRRVNRCSAAAVSTPA